MFLRVQELLPINTKEYIGAFLLRILTKTLLGACVLWTLACQPFQDYTISPPPPAGSSTSSQGPDPIRPTDDGEGLPGYLVNPKMLSISREADGLRVIASPGAIVNMSSAPISLVVMEISSVTNKNFTVVAQDSYSLEGAFKSSVKPLEDGSLNEFVAYTTDNPIVAFLSKFENSSVVKWTSSADQIHAVFYDPAAIDGTKALTVSVLGTRYPEGVDSKLPELQYTTQKACNDAGYFWQWQQNECTSTNLVKLTHCWPNQDQAKLIALIGSLNFSARDNMLEEIDNLVQQGFGLDQCYYVNEAMFYIQFAKQDGNAKSVERVDGDVVDFKSVILP